MRTPVHVRAARRLLMLGLAALLCGGVASSVAAESPGVLERRVKAAFLYKFAGYVDWPGTAFREETDPLVIGVFGDDPMAEELERLVQGRRSSGRLVLVRRVTDPAEPGNVHLLFQGRSSAARLPDIRRGLGARPVLLVTEWPGALEQGSMINFVLDGGRVRFEVDLDAVEGADLGLSSRLLAVARTVTQKRS
jgi:uncharacterized protein DUF4154